MEYPPVYIDFRKVVCGNAIAKLIQANGLCNQIKNTTGTLDECMFESDILRNERFGNVPRTIFWHRSTNHPYAIRSFVQLVLGEWLSINLNVCQWIIGLFYPTDLFEQGQQLYTFVTNKISCCIHSNNPERTLPPVGHDQSFPVRSCPLQCVLKSPTLYTLKVFEAFILVFGFIFILIS